MEHHTSVIGYFLQAGWVVKLVMLFLAAASITSWTLILQRAWFFRRMKQEYTHFSTRFWQTRDLSQLFNEVANSHQKKGLSAIFYAGFKEYGRLNKQGAILLEPIQRAMQISQAKEALTMENHLSFLASVGAIAPYIGLFGTVWGIMSSFQALGQTSQATIAMVAPGISEALLATALGLFTAIPAVLAYNRYTNHANTLLDNCALFQDELVALIEQQTHHNNRSEPC